MASSHDLHLPAAVLDMVAYRQLSLIGRILLHTGPAFSCPEGRCLIDPELVRSDARLFIAELEDVEGGLTELQRLGLLVGFEMRGLQFAFWPYWPSWVSGMRFFRASPHPLPGSDLLAQHLPYRQWLSRLTQKCRLRAPDRDFSEAEPARYPGLSAPPPSPLHLPMEEGGKIAEAERKAAEGQRRGISTATPTSTSTPPPTGAGVPEGPEERKRSGHAVRRTGGQLVDGLGWEAS